MVSSKKVFVTTGDTDGIGPEITIKAFHEMASNNICHFIWGSSSFCKDFITQHSAKFKIQQLDKPDKQTLINYNGDAQIVLLNSDGPAPHWVEISAQLCFEKSFDGIVTGPLSKGLILDSGLKDIGHTQILKRVTGVNHVNMFFIGHQFNVLLATDHIPLCEVSNFLNESLLKDSLTLAHQALSFIDPQRRELPIRVLGLNPHAGENGLLGNEESDWIKRCLTEVAELNLRGPEVPDAAFLKADKTSVFVALYHDQGLIPFKLVHKHNSVHVTLGLPFPRTSVDHGTAKDIYGKNRADCRSMHNALIAMQNYLVNERFFV